MRVIKQIYTEGFEREILFTFVGSKYGIRVYVDNKVPLYSPSPNMKEAIRWAYMYAEGV